MHYSLLLAFLHTGICPYRKLEGGGTIYVKNMFQAVLHTEHRIGTAQRPHNPWRITLYQTDPDANRNEL